ncbi:MAG: ATP-binding protein, partial [Candidatus Aenigmarchaeota archaeon]|nr:ATP-binding protein [Candidatus Aenigmarchaeota archaeon]
KVKKLDYVAIKTPEGEWVTAYIDNMTRYADKTIANCHVIGYRNPRGFLVVPNVPFAPETPVFSASEEQIRGTLGIPEDGLYIGILDGYDIKVNLPVKQLMTKHVSVLAKTGAGKSYMAGVLLEEFAEKKLPVVVIDPHGEYSSLCVANDDEKEMKFADKFGIESKSYADQVRRFSIEDNNLKLNAKLSADDIFQCLPVKVSGTQKGLIYSALRNIGGKDYTLTDLINEISTLPSQSKWNLISALEFLDKTRLFSKTPTRPEELVKPGQVSIIDIKYAKPEIQQTIVFKLAQELFSARKRGTIPGFFLVLEEAHTFCPERGFGEVSSSKIIRTIASEGRKFGLSLCIITQRPARVDKNVLSQCNTQIIMKVTNPNDLKAITDSAEGITPGMREEIRDLPVGSALVVGVTEQPVLTEIRVRRSKHGGESVLPSVKAGPMKVRNTALPPRFDKKKIEESFKDATVFQVNYPVWFLKGTVNGDNVSLYIDGLMGEVMYESRGELKRTNGLKSLVTLSSTERKIISTLLSIKYGTLEKVATATRLMNNDCHRLLKNLMDKGLVTSDGYNFRPV